MHDRQTIFLLYHFFHPDDVISARLYTEMAEDLKAAGHHVVALPSNRSCHHVEMRLASNQDWNGICIRRVWRPAFSQARAAGRLLNSFFMLFGWTCWALFCGRTKTTRTRASRETVIIGTDPIFGILASIPWRLFRPNIRIVHWCHDVHPEASLADGSCKANSLAIRCLRKLLRIAYRRCDVVVDLGSCMRGLLTTAGGWQIGDAAKPDFATITPWALIEAQQPAMIHRPARQALFADAKLTLLYSGNMGRAHDLDLLLALARICQAYPIGFCFAGRGPGIEALKSKLTIEDTNVTLADFASESELHARLSAGDIHMVSLKESWTGTVVPSKFFGALAMGRPVLFAGSAESSIAKWIKLHQVGWHLTSESLSEISAELIALLDHPQLLYEKNRHCWEIYRQYFSREVQLSKWRELVARPALSTLPTAMQFQARPELEGQVESHA